MDGKIENKRKRVWIFRTMAISVSLILIVVIELLLRLAGFGHSYDLFVKSKQNPGYYVMNEFASQKYFTSADEATVGYYEPFAMKKAPDTYRIFVLGESTTVGFPYAYNGSFHRWLKYRLMFAFPQVNFEIINLSLTAVNSYTVADFAEQVVDYDPDAILIYVGHNEYYGALGVGSSLKIGNNPKIVRSILKLRQLRIYQLINRLIQGISKAGDAKKLSNESLMQQMPADKQIPYESKKYWQAIEQFSYNMNRTCKILAKKNIPVLISNVVSNEKDLKPFISATDPAVSAHNFFDKARKDYQNENFEEAKKLFVKAKEYDMLRFRAPEAINQEIEKLAQTYNQVKLVDTRSRFEEASPHGIIGNETLLEHVHPNLYGYALLSDAFFNRMKDLKMVGANWSRAMSFDRLLKEMPVNKVDSLKGAYQIRFMLNEWPFTNHPVPKTEIIHPETELEKNCLKLTVGELSWDKVQSQLYAADLQKGDHEGALKIGESFALINPQDPELLLKVATLSMDANRKPKAAFYFAKAFKLNKTVKGAQQLGKLYTEIDDPENALLYYQYLLSSDRTNKIYKLIADMLRQMIKEKQALLTNNNDVGVLNQLAWQYVQLRSITPARKYLSRSLAIDANNEETRQVADALAKLEDQKQQAP